MDKEGGNILNQYTFCVYLMHWFVLTAILRFVKINTTFISWRLIAPFGIDCNQYRDHMYYSEDSDIKTCNTIKLRKHRRTE